MGKVQVAVNASRYLRGAEAIQDSIESIDNMRLKAVPKDQEEKEEPDKDNELPEIRQVSIMPANIVRATGQGILDALFLTDKTAYYSVRRSVGSYEPTSDWLNKLIKLALKTAQDPEAVRLVKDIYESVLHGLLPRLSAILARIRRFTGVEEAQKVFKEHRDEGITSYRAAQQLNRDVMFLERVLGLRGEDLIRFCVLIRTLGTDKIMMRIADREGEDI